VKRIVICADGTWNVRDQVDEKTGHRHPTNVTKLTRAVVPRDSHGVEQVVFYHEGVGTDGGVSKFTEGAFGHGIEDNIRDLYRSIVYNYMPGDELFLFGFSRGAFTVRSLAGFMKFAGLVEKDDDFFVPDLYACYESKQGNGTLAYTKATKRIKGTRPPPPIKMIGVWDTVGALGAPGWLGKAVNPSKYANHDVGLYPQIQHAYHALAIDERRKPFAPNLWSIPDGWTGVLEQVWFPGVHCNVGGGYSPDGLANGALHWMVDKAAALGLQFDQAYLAPFQAHANSYLADNMDMKYKLMGPITRAVGAQPKGNESLHPSVHARMADADCKYHPRNLPLLP
jgi:uncharacterized protein (DUF2235 family)